MDRLARLRLRSSSVGGALNSSSVSLGNGAGYETANDESITSGGSMYFSLSEEGGGDATATNVSLTMEEEEQQQNKKPVAAITTVVTDENKSIDQTLENDFSVEEVSTIRKPMIVQASPATVKVASKMACKYLGVSSTPAAKVRKTPVNGRRSLERDLSGLAKLDESEEKKTLPAASTSLMVRMREPKLSEGSSAEDGDDTKLSMDNSVQLSMVETGRGGAPVGNNKSYGTNVLAQFFESLDVNKATPIPTIKVTAPEDEEKAGQTPHKRRESNRLQNFFESLKKNPEEGAPGKENRPKSERKPIIRKSLIPSAAAQAARLKARKSLQPSPSIVKATTTRKSSAVKLLPERVREMRKANQMELVSMKRKSCIPPPPKATVVAAAPKVQLEKTPSVTPSEKQEEIVGDSVKVKSVSAVSRASTLVKPAATKPLTGTIPKVATVNNNIIAAKRKSTLPVTAASRRSVLPAKTLRKSVVPSMGLGPPKAPLRVPAKTTLNTSLGKRSIAQISTDKPAEPLAKLRKSVAPQVTKTEPSSSTAVRPVPSKIRPPVAVPSAIPTSTGPTAFKKPETFSCDTCQRSFRLKTSLESHKKLTHKNGSLTSSPAMGAASSPANSINSGTDSPSSSPDTKCQHCSKSFINARILSNHLVNNCLKIPPLEKRKLLASQNDSRQRAATALSPRERAKTQRLTRPSTAGFLGLSATSPAAGAASSDTSSSSSIGDASSSSVNTNRSRLTGVAAAAAKAAALRKRAIGHTGITRTPTKEMKCHLCGRRFLNAVEYALHVQAHAKQGQQQQQEEKQESGEATSEQHQKEEARVVVEMPSNGLEIVQKIANLRKKAGNK